METFQIKEFKNIYYWEASLFNGRRVWMPLDDDHIKEYECRFIDLDTSQVRTFTLKPLHSNYAPIRIQTNGKPFKYYIRWVRNLLTQKIICAFYILITEEKVYIVRYPEIEYKIFRNIEEAEEYLGKGI